MNEADPREDVERTDEASFDRDVLQRPGRVAALFWTDWCPYARRFLPLFEAADLGMTKVLVDVSDEGPLWDRYRIPVVPSIVVFADGHEVVRENGRSGYGLDVRALDRLRSQSC